MKVVCMRKYIWAHESFDINEGIVWFIPYGIDLLCGYSIDEKKVIFTKILPNFSGKSDRYLNVKYVEGNIIMIPSYADFIYIYNIRNDKLFSNNVNKYPSARFYQCINDGNSVIVYPFEADSYIRIVLNNEEEPLFEKVSIKHNKIVASVLANGKKYGVNRNKYVLDLTKDSVLVECIDDQKVVFTDIVDFDSKYMVVADSNGGIYRLDMFNNALEKWFNVDGKVHSVAYCGNQLVIFPETENRFFWIYDLIGEAIKKVSLNLNNCNKKWTYNAFSKAIVKDGYVYVMDIYDESLLKINLTDLSVSAFYIQIPELTYDQKATIYGLCRKDICLAENKIEEIDLDFFLSYVCDTKRG